MVCLEAGGDVMGSRIVTPKTEAKAVAAETGRGGGWNGSRIGMASAPPPRIVRAVPEGDLDAARGISVALLGGLLIWVGVGWGASSLLARFF